MSADHQEIVIVRRRSVLEDEHHGGAWKIAFADFMTAMMAFFLVLWIISATDKNTKTIIARYFNPVKVEEPARSQKGIHGAEDLNAQTPGGDLGSRSGDKSHLDRDETSSKSSAEAHQGSAQDGGSGHQPASGPSDPAKPTPTMSEEELFRDPWTSLDRIAGPSPAAARVESELAPLQGFGDTDSDDSYRDPFRPLGGDKATHASVSTGRSAAAGAPQEEERTTIIDSAADAGLQGHQENPQKPSATQEAPKPGPAMDATKPPSPPVPAPAKSEVSQAAGASQTPAEAARGSAAALLADVMRRLGPEASSTPGPKLDVQATDEGILISLTDRQNFSMFPIGSAEPQPRVVHMIDAIAASLEATSGAIVVRGHTDAHPYRTARYDNWRLSSARAQMAYYMLNCAGVPEKRFERIEGFADHRLKDQARPFAAENRRIEILLRGAKP